MPKFKFDNRADFVVMVGEMFNDKNGDIGEIVALMIEHIEGKSAQDVMCALSFMTAYIIDSVPEKREAMDEFIQVASKFIHFDQPAFKGISKLQ